VVLIVQRLLFVIYLTRLSRSTFHFILLYNAWILLHKTINEELEESNGAIQYFLPEIHFSFKVLKVFKNEMISSPIRRPKI